MDPHHKRILVVDDEAHILHVLSLKLANAGFEVLTAGDGEEGMEVAVQEQPDLLITDYQMPFMTGLELCQRLRHLPQTRNLPALMLTARGFTLTATDLEQTNIVGVLSKPFSPRDVLSRVQQLVGQIATSHA